VYPLASILELRTLLRVLMVSTEYPPMPGGVGRYTANLTESLKRIDVDMHVASNEKELATSQVFLQKIPRIQKFF
jgi:hypothetical protein